ncbi:hypothetical protein [Nonomuraea sp. NPDC050786]|uniref:rhamnogalacturonan lyase family protein n=1 Tax=Nonomuraea sp. NPDC050786 TaxID=3154840 RepID=UPI0033E5C3AB
MADELTPGFPELGRTAPFGVCPRNADGKNEIVYGAMAINDNGSPLWNTRNGHGDAMHVGDLDPSRPGLEEFKVDEDSSKPAAWFADVRTGRIIWQNASCGCDNGRGVSADIWAGSPGAESWSAAVGGCSTAPTSTSTERAAVTTTKIHTLLHDPQYRAALAWQNTAYNQPPHPSFFIGAGMATPAQPRVYLR